MTSRNGSLGFLDMITIASLLLQVINFDMDLSQSSNDELLKELHHQDRDYLGQIIENQKKILELLTDKQVSLSGE